MTGFALTPEIMQRFAGSLLHFIWQGAAIALLASICLRLLQQRSAEARYAVSVAALVAMLAAPVLTFIFYSETGALALQLLQLTGKTLTDAAAVPSFTQAAATAAWTQWILAAWSVGVFAFTARLVAGWRFSRRLVSDSETVIPQSVLQVFAELKEQMELIQPIRLLIHARIDTPMVVGCLKPAVLVPLSALTGLNEEQLTAILAHELAHIRRHDFLINILQRCVESLLFYHPGVWWLSGRIRAEREHCCDDVAIRVCGDRRTYVQALIELERKRQTIPVLSVAAAGGSMVQRVHRILGIRTTSSDWQSAAATLSFALLWLFLGAWQSAGSLQAKPVLPPAPAAPVAVVLPVASPAPVAEGINAIAAILTAQPIAEPQNAAAAQNPQEPGVVQGVVTRLGTSEPYSGVQVALEGAVNPQAMQGVLNSAAGVGIVVTPQPGATAAELTQLLISAAAARGLPVGAPAITNLVNNSIGKQDWPTTVSGTDGRFSFRDVKPGRYTVRATRDGYFGKPVAGVYPPTAALEITVVAGDVVQSPLAMVQGAILGGRVFDMNGEPLSNAGVQAFAVAYQNGFSLLQPAVTKTTDDRGEFRLFWLPPGDYYISATRTPIAPFAGGQPPPRTFYPGVARLNEAIPTTIRGGEDLRGMDMALRSAGVFKISGRVTSSVAAPPSDDGSPLVTVNLHLADRDLQTPTDSTTANQAGRLSLTPNTGLFEITGVPPGSYEVLARVADPAVGTGLAAFSWGRALVEVTDRDVRDVAIAISSSPALKGVVRTVGGVSLPPNLRIALTPMGGTSRVALYGLVATRGTVVAADGSFAVASVPPGQFRLGALPGLPADYYIADVRQNSGSVFDSGFTVGSREPEPIEILIAAGAGVIQGVVQDGPTKVAVPGAVVALVPEPGRLENRALYATAVSDASGRFTFRGVAPGDYQLFAWESTPQNAYQSISFLKKYEGQGRLVRVTQKGTVTVEVPVAK